MTAGDWTIIGAAIAGLCLFGALRLNRTDDPGCDLANAGDTRLLDILTPPFHSSEMDRGE